jgi:hypothetical protein
MLYFGTLFIFILMQTWFFEYFPIGGDYRKGSGGIPRCHNWDLSNSSRVITFSKMIERIPEGRVCEKLTRTPEERKYQEIKFLAVDHIDLVRTGEGLTKPENKMLKNLLVEMAPNYKILGFEVCEEVSQSARTGKFLFLHNCMVIA